MKTAYLSPLPPVRSGIASYSAMLLPSLAERLDLTVVVAQEEWEPCGVDVVGIDEYRRRRDQFQTAIYQLGNNPHHEFIYDEALQHPGIAVLHEIVLHHLIAEMTMARGDVAGYREALRENHGAVGEAWAAGRAAGFHGEIANFILPASLELARRSRAVIVHNRYAAERLRDLGVSTPVHVIGHPLVATAVGGEPRAALRARLGYSEQQRVAGMFGFVTAAKRPEVVFEGFAKAAARDPGLRLLVVGEPAPNIDLAALSARFGIPADRWQATGYASDSDFDRYIEAVDLVVSLRYPTAGETSGALLRVLHAGRPVVVNDYAQFAEIPRGLATRIELGDGEVEGLAAFLLARDGEGLPAARRRWVEEHGDVGRSADAIASIVAGSAQPVATPPPRSPRLPIALFPAIRATLRSVQQSGSAAVAIVRLENSGTEPVVSVMYGQPGYRVLVKGFGPDGEAFDSWLKLPCDLVPGAGLDLPVGIPRAGSVLQLRLHHALQGVPLVESEPFAVLEL